MINFIYYSSIIFGVIFLLYTIYYATIALFFRRKGLQYPQATRNNRFAILCPARNEANVIGDLVKSLQNQDYPKECYDIIVVPNNCTDNTKDVALEAGAKIFEPVGTIKSKGEVLNQVIDHVLDQDKYDAIIVFDSDNLVDPNFIKAMNKALEAGYPAGTCFRDSKNPTTTRLSSAYSIFYFMFSSLYNGARSMLGMNSLISGTGFMVSTSLLKELGGWNTVSITEDAEFSCQLAVKGEKIAYVPRAITYDEQPEDLKESLNQRLRWSLGSQQISRLYTGDLLRKSIKKEGQNPFDFFIYSIATYMQIVAFVLGILGLVIAAFSGARIFFIALAILIASAFLSQAILAIIVLCATEKPIRPMYKGILTFWLFTLSWVPLHIIALFKRDMTWKEISHKKTES